MDEKDLILIKLAEIKPESILDIGCGTGEFTDELGRYADGVTGIDIDEGRINEAKKRNAVPNVHYRCIDILHTPFPEGIYDVCISRFALHHVHEWKSAIDEAMRLSRKHILIEEPFFDLRSEEKKRTYEVTKVFLDLHHEVGFSHNLYLERGTLLDYLKQKPLRVEIQVVKSDELMTFDEYFGVYMRFVEQSKRKSHWEERINRLRDKHQGKVFCDDDILYVFCRK
jgi:ubiquinone/menaquinone biosynthesis C-methylase UbiE